jgi:hypothetical protein
MLQLSDPVQSTFGIRRVLKIHQNKDCSLVRDQRYNLMFMQHVNARQFVAVVTRCW